jgi:hypothetical protein
MVRFNHASPFDVTGPTRGPWPSLFLLYLSFFLHLFHFAAAPLMILDFSSLIGARDVTNRLHEFVFQACWVRTSSLPSHFPVF